MFKSKFEAIKVAINNNAKILTTLVQANSSLGLDVAGVKKSICNLGHKIATGLQAVEKSFQATNDKHDALKRRVELLEQHLGVEFYVESSVHTEGYRKVKEVKAVKATKKTKTVTKKAKRAKK